MPHNAIFPHLDKNIYFEIKARVHAFSSGGQACKLCLTEKLVVLTADQNSMLDKRDELLETYRHRRKHLLVSFLKKNKPLTLPSGNRGYLNGFIFKCFKKLPF